MDGDIKMKLTKAEAINLIIGFFVTPTGYWVDVKYDDTPELTRFIAAGYTCLDEEDDRKIIPNEQGKEILFMHFSEMSREFISFMINKGMECSVNEVEKWFVEKYNLSDINLAEDISFLVAKKLKQFGYKSLIPCPERKDDKIILQKSEDHFM